MTLASKNKSKVVVAKYLVTILLPLVIILTNLIFLVYNISFQAEIQQKVKSTLNIDDRIRQNVRLIHYYQGKELLDHNFYSPQAVNHLKEVKDILTSGQIIFGMSTIVILLMYTIIARAKRYEIIFTATFYGSVICLVFSSLLALGLLVQFDTFFNILHAALFKSNSWAFPGDDNLIQVFPAEFFVLFAKQLSLNVIYTSATLVALSIIGKLLIRKKKSS